MIADKIPLLDLQPEIQSLKSEFMEAIESVLDSGQFIMGPEVKSFEQEAAEYLGVKHAIGVNSGTDALVLGIRALGVKAGDEVITTPFTFFATGECISHVGATPVFVDIDQDTFNINPDLIEAAITDKTTAILPVHLYGHPANMYEINAIAKKHNLKVLEDAAQSWGSIYKANRVGTLADGCAFSFFPSKNLGAFGDGGLFTTDNDEVADTVRMLRVHGARKKYHNETVGANSRLDSIQAAILRVKLRHIDEWNQGRREAAARYTEMFDSVAEVVAPPVMGDVNHVFHQYTIRITNGKRDEVQAKLGEQNIGSFVYYPIPVDKLPVYKDLAPSKLPVSDRLTTEVLSLPIWPTISPETQTRVVEVIKSAL